MIKCGLGLCGSCIIDGDNFSLRVCVEGPTLTSDILKKLKDFGISQYDETGMKVPIS